MIRLQRITTADTGLYEYMEQLMVASFPPDEYRALGELRSYTDTQSRFHNNIVLDNDTPIGLITYWDFGRFYYIEHFAIDPTQRNGGQGSRALQHVCRLLQAPIVLEVELPEEEMAIRRIGFYQRQGFVLWEKAYRQPPYKPGDNFLPMYLMVYGNLECEKEFGSISKQIHQTVYKYTQPDE